MIYDFTVRPSKQDFRDLAYQITDPSYISDIDLREWNSPVQDQGHAGSCVSNALTSAYELMVRHQYPDKFVELSRLFVYYNSRVIEESINEDAGILYIKDSLDSITKQGVCSEELWPYNLESLTSSPTPECYADALKRTIIKTEHIYSLRGMIQALNEKKPITIGMEVYSGFMRLTSDDPVVPMPEFNEYTMGSLGGHSVLIVGYSLPKKQFLIKNSFGTDWGDNGYGWLSFEYNKKFIFERWCFDISDQITLIERSPMSNHTSNDKDVSHDIT